MESPYFQMTKILGQESNNLEWLVSKTYQKFSVEKQPYLSEQFMSIFDR